MQDKLKDNKEDYNYLTHEDWCDLLSTADIRDNRKRAETQIKKIESDRAASNYDSAESVRVPRKKEATTGVLYSNPNRKAPKHHGSHRHYVLCKKSGMPEQKYMPHSSEDFLASAPTISSPGMDWEDPQKVGLKL